MSASIEEKIVAMKLNNSQFEANAKQSLGTLDRIKNALKLDGASKGLQNVSAAAKNTNLSNVAAGVDTIASKFTAMGVIGVTALATIANKAVTAGAQLVKSLTISPISAGFSDYNEKLTSVQTIMNATGASLEEVSGYFKELDTYADKTIYNLSDMTGAFAKFTNAGVDMSESVPAIKGIANMVALAGQNAGAASIAMYNLSQSIAGGFLTTTDYRSLNLANVATKEWKQNMIDAAVSAGTLKKVGKDSYKVVGSSAEGASTSAALFNEKLSEGWATSKVLLSVLGDYGDVTTEIGRKALAAAQDVKSLPMMLDTLKAAVGTGWTDTFEIILGTLPEAKKLFTGLTLYIGGFLDKMSDARNKVLGDWKTLGGRDDLFEGLKNSFQAILSIIKPITDAFGEIFPPMTGKRLADMTKSFRDFTEGLKMGGENADRLKRIFAGVFAILNVGYTIVKGVATTLLNLFGLAQGGAGGFLELAASVGDFVVAIQEWVSSSGRIQSFFATINTARAAILVPLFNIIGKLAEALSLLFSGDIEGFGDKLGEAFSGVGALIQGVFNSMTGPLRNFLANARDVFGTVGTFLKETGVAAFKPIGDALVKLGENFGKIRTIISNFGFDLFNTGAAGAKGTMDGLATTGEKIAAVWSTIKEAFKSTKEFLAPAAESIGKLFTAITDKLREWITNMNFDDVLAIINTGFFILMYKAITDFMKSLKGIGESIGGVADSISGTFNLIKTSLTSALETMQANVKANIILKIAIAIGVLALSLKLLSTIDPADLAQGIAAIGVLMYAMTKAMGSMMGMLDVVEGESPKKVGSVLAVGGAMLLLAGAILILSFAVKQLAGLNWEELAKGLIGVGVLLGALTLFTKYAETETESLKGAVGILLLAGAIYLLSTSVSKLGEMDTAKLVQGTVAVVALLAVLGEVSRRMADPKAMAGAVAIIALAAALAILTPVIAALGLLPYEILAKGLGSVGLLLGMLAIASQKMGDPKTIAGAVGIMALAVALSILAPVLSLLGLLPYEVLAKGLVTIGLALAMLAIASQAMGNPMALQGAVGVMAMAAALMMLAPVILILGQADLSTLAIGLGAVAVALGIFLLAGLAAMYVGPGLLVLGASLALVGVGLGLAGAGFLAFATGFAAFAAIGVAGFAVITAGFMGLLQLIPLAAQQIGLGIRAIAVVIAGSGPQIIAAITTVLIAFLKAIENAIPQFMRTMEKLIVSLIQTVQRMIPKLAASGAQMIIKLLAVLATYVGPMADKATDLMIAFIRAIGRNVPRLVDAGAKAIIDLLNGIASAIRGNADELRAAGRNIASAIVEGMVGGIGNGISAVTTAAKNLAKKALSAAKNFLGINSPSKEFEKLGKFSADGYAKGLIGSKAASDAAVQTMTNMINAALNAQRKSIKSLEAKLKSLTSARKKDVKAIASTTKALAEARNEYDRTTQAWSVNRGFSDEIRSLDALGARAVTVSAKIVEAQKAVDEARAKSYLDFSQGVKDQFDNLADPDKDTKLGDYITNLQKQVADTQILRAQLEKLKEMGLSDAMYQELLAKGTESIPFATQILDGGQIAVNELNSLQSSLDRSASELGKSAGQALYLAGINTAEGLVAGLKSEEADIKAEILKIASSMTTEIKKALGIKSPSRVFAAIGKFSGAGLAKGLTDSTAVAEKAADKMGHDAINSLRKSLSGLSESVLSEVDVNPTIRPVLDLSEIQKDSVKMGEMLNGRSVSVGASYGRASAVAREHSATQAAREELALAGGGTNVTFNQTNNSPKALSTAEIYRQNKNQISKMKGALKI